jgi:radical SAM superfamily enzyme with C-terminal helix-hairpin-helix motif
MITILDCYTDEPAGLGVPPYLGTYPRYIAGSLNEEVNYITIDDLRFQEYYNLEDKKKNISHKTNIKIYNLTNNINNIKEILEKTTKLIIILGVHTPGKYLSALPGTLKEVVDLTSELKCEKILTGPVVYGTQLEGGKFFEKIDLRNFKIKNFDFNYNEIKNYSIKGADIIKQIPNLRIIEIETSHGCSRLKGCSFCTEPIKHKLEFRDKEDIILEIRELYKLGCKYFRLGKQSCFYSYPNTIDLLKDIRKECKDIKVLHIDNVNPVNIISKKGIEITKAIVKYCTPGNVAAFGIESFDPVVIEENNLNCKPKQALEAVKTLNKYGAKRSNNGMPHFLPGINLLFGLKGETKQTHNYNFDFLKNILKQNLLLRRINIRQVSIFEGTPLYKTCRNKFLRKNKKYYWKWRNDIRQNIDFPMLKKIVPKDTILKNVRMEIHDGNTTFGRQLGTYPLIVGIKQRLDLNKFYDIKITDHMLRSVTGIAI